MLLKDLLQIPSLRNTRIAAGVNGLSRNVVSVNMMDAPDIIHYLRPQELLLTTAYAVKDQPESLEELVHQMAGAGCAGLAIKTKRFLEEIPSSVIETANDLHFPLLELSLDYSLGEVLNGALSSILENKTDELTYALETHHTFFNLILNGEGLSEIVEKLSQLIAAPVVILGPQLELISLSVSNKPNLKRLNDFLAGKPGNKQPLAGGLYHVLASDGSGNDGIIMLQPIPTYQRQGYIAAFPRDESHQKLHGLALEQAANVLGFEMLKTQAVKDRARRFKIDFFTELVQGDIQSEQEIIHRGKQYGLFPGESMLCILCGREGDERQTPGRNDPGAMEKKARETDALYQDISKQLQLLKSEGVLFTLKDKFVLLLHGKEWIGSAAEGKLRLAGQLTNLAEAIASASAVQLNFGISSPFSKLLDIPKAFKQATDAYKLGRSHNKAKFVQFYHTKELVDLLKLIPVDDLQEFVRDTFEDWSGIEESEQLEWRRTLSVFYDNHCHIGETAKQLYIHRNTVLYRLNRIEQLTGAQVRNPADSLRIRMALQIKEMLM
ncbi:PucR family transcriptional regulator [Paenibacillus sp. CAU 1782]